MEKGKFLIFSLLTYSIILSIFLNSGKTDDSKETLKKKFKDLIFTKDYSISEFDDSLYNIEINKYSPLNGILKNINGETSFQFKNDMKTICIFDKNNFKEILIDTINYKTKYDEGSLYVINEPNYSEKNDTIMTTWILNNSKYCVGFKLRIINTTSNGVKSIYYEDYKIIENYNLQDLKHDIIYKKKGNFI